MGVDLMIKKNVDLGFDLGVLIWLLIPGLIDLGINLRAFS